MSSSTNIAARRAHFQTALTAFADAPPPKGLANLLNRAVSAIAALHSVVDVCGVLAESADAGAYWRKLKQRLTAEGSEVVTNCHGLKLEAPDGKQRITDCANTEGLLRIIQSIPSPRAEPFKRWLAQVGYERVKEIENPELASARARELYQAKGYPQAWIEKRLRSIAVRGELTDEWKMRGVQEGKEYSILTAEIARATFGVTPCAHSRLKGHRDISALIERGLVEKDEDGKLFVPFSRIHAEFDLAKAA